MTAGRALLLVLAFVAAGCAAQPGASGQPTLASAPAAAPAAGLDSLTGKSGGEVETLIGKPGLVRRDGPAEIWQYRGAACTANLFFWRAGGGLRLDHAEAQDAGGKRMAAAACLETVAR